MLSLHYTTVKLGTPGMRFMVALDTGSDLFWVPCDCGKCAPTEGPAYSSVNVFTLNLVAVTVVEFTLSYTTLIDSMCVCVCVF